MNNFTPVIPSIIVIFLAFVLLPGNLYAEEGEDEEIEEIEEIEGLEELDDLYAAYLTDESPLPERTLVLDTFGEWLLINTQTTEQIRQGALGMNIQHRFGQVSSDFGELFGIYAPANIRLAFTYGITDRISLGLATTKFQSLQDFHGKVAILRQTTPGGMPVSLSYFGQTTLRGNPAEDFDRFLHRLAFHHQLLLARNFSHHFSGQIGLSYLHFNLVDRHGLGHQHDDFALSLIGKIRATPTMAVIFEGAMGQLFYTPREDAARSYPSFGLGLEIITTGHAFQIFVTSTNDVVPGRLYSFNPHDLLEGSAFLGFNITRRWSL
ncbi:MAG: DUF5777 family beta-barrel protein [Bradymonadaceae bacterium]